MVTLRDRPRALVARPEGQAGPLLGALAAAGIDAVHVPAIEIRPAAAGGTLDDAVRSAEPGDWVVVTSANAASAATTAMARLGVETMRFRWAAVGQATAAVLLDAGIDGVFVPTVADGATLAAELPLAPGDRVLVPHGDIADPALATALAGRGARVHAAIAYATVEAPDASRPLLAAALDDGPVDVLVLTSGSTVRGLVALAGDAARAAVLATPVVAAGEKAAQAAADAGFSLVLVAPGPDAATLADMTARSLGVPEPAAAHDPDLDPAPAQPGGAR